MAFKIKISEKETILLSVWIDKWDEEKKAYVEKCFYIGVRGEHLCISDNSCSIMKIKKGFWADKEKAPFGKILDTIYKLAMKRKAQEVGFIFISLED